MTVTARSPADRRRRTTRRWGAVGPLVAVLAAVTASGAACGGGSNHAAPRSSSDPSAPSSARQSGLAFASCMRANGVSNFPDSAVSVNDGQVQFDFPRGVKGEPQFPSAIQACQSDLPRSSGPTKHFNVPEELNFASCMRAHGVSGFPDPLPSGGFDLDELPAGAGLPGSTESPQFETAADACRSTGIHWNGP
jgi:hypothetical protein